MQSRFLLDDDGHNTFSTLTEHYQRDIDDVVAVCPANVTTYLLCCGAGRYYYPTKIAGVDPRCVQLNQEHARGHDPFGYFLQRVKAAGKEAFVTFRMNDVHNPEDTDDWNTPTVRKKHPDCIVDLPAVQRGDKDWFNFALDYSRPEVFAHFMAIFRELIARYPLDGLQLDWMRFPRHLSGTPGEVWAKRTHLTRFVTEIRALTRARGIKLCVRVPTSLAGCRFLGTDVVEWARLGLVDFVSTCAFLNTDFFQPLHEIRAAMGAHAVPLYAGFDFEHGAQRHNPESLRAACTALYESGADGINLFNFPCWRESLACVPYHWLEGLESPATACKKPLLYSVAQHRHRKPGVDLPGLLPAVAAPGASLTLPLRLPAAAFPIKRPRLLVQTSAPCTATLNGQPLELFPRTQGAELFLEYSDERDEADRRPRRDDSHCFRCDPALFRPGENTLEIRGPADTPLTVRRINLAIW